MLGPLPMEKETDMPVWDPERYLAYAGQRGRPFVDLLAHVGATDPTRVLDLGCGPGNLTGLLAERWPDAVVEGIDSSAQMIERARADADPRVAFAVGDVRDVAGGSDTAAGYDVIVTNAVLQWLPDHLDLLPGLLGALAPGGWLALQVPGNFDSPSHLILHELAGEQPYAAHRPADMLRATHEPAVYLETLLEVAESVDVWETTYLHVLAGPDPVFTWISGTGARPMLQALPDDLRPRFEAEFKQRLTAAYPPRPFGTVLPFRRVFAVARVADVADGSIGGSA